MRREACSCARAAEGWSVDLTSLAERVQLLQVGCRLHMLSSGYNQQGARLQVNDMAEVSPMEPPASLGQDSALLRQCQQGQALPRQTLPHTVQCGCCCAGVVKGQAGPLMRETALICPEIHGETGALRRTATATDIPMAVLHLWL